MFTNCIASLTAPLITGAEALPFTAYSCIFPSECIFQYSAPLPFARDFYEAGALMLEEEGTVIVGMLVGLNVIDANLCVKGEDLDSQVRSSFGFSSTVFSLLFH